MAQKKSSKQATAQTQQTQRDLLGLIILAVLILLIVGLAFWAYTRQGGTGSIGSSPSPSSSVMTSPSPTATAAATITPAPVPSPVASTGPVTACATGNLAGSLDATGGGTAGTLYRQLILTNRSNHRCTVYGFPGVSLVNASGVQLGAPAARSGAAGPTITLAPGQAAASAVGFPDAGNFEPGACSAMSTSLKVYPPNQTTTLLIPLAAQYCPGFSVQTLAAH